MRALLRELLIFSLITLKLLPATVGFSFNQAEGFSHASRRIDHPERKLSHHYDQPILEKHHYIHVSYLESEAKEQGKKKNSFDNENNSDASKKAEAHSAHHHKKKIEAVIIASIFGGLLFLFVCLILTMCLSRYRERRHNDNSTGLFDSREEEHSIVARRICRSDQEGRSPRMMPLFGTEGQTQGHAFQSREGDTGWTYMNHIARGLERSTLTASQSPNDIFDRSNNRQSYLSQQKDEELPSYSMIELHQR